MSYLCHLEPSDQAFGLYSNVIATIEDNTSDHSVLECYITPEMTSYSFGEKCRQILCLLKYLTLIYPVCYP